ncbi:hypothetical protein PUN28_018981 [Cardiocondyla obscurior]|uniref:Secreted protein n=1 Tax=Cardiocondyla obscurior TaxID=286306 RepID=A0AAW2EIB1_9HYME
MIVLYVATWLAGSSGREITRSIFILLIIGVDHNRKKTFFIFASTVSVIRCVIHVRVLATVSREACVLSEARRPVVTDGRPRRLRTRLRKKKYPRPILVLNAV